MKLLITGSRSYAALDMARQLKRAGFDVYTADCVKYPVCKASNAVTRNFTIPSPRDHYRLFIDSLIAIIQQFHIDILIPSCEEVFYIAKGAHILNKYCQVFCDSFEKLSKLHNKWEFSLLTEHCSVRTPPTTLLRSAEDLQMLPQKSEYYVFKPIFTRFGARTLIAPAADKLPRIEPSEQDQWIAQQFVAGKEYCSYHIAVDGRIQAHSCYEPLYRLGKASSYYFHPIRHMEMERFAEQFVQQHHFTGHIAFDFIQGNDGQLYVLECNPRTTSGLHVMAPNMLARMMEQSVVDHNPGVHTEAKTKPRMIAYAMLANPLYHGFQGIRRWAADVKYAKDVLYDHEDRLVPLFHALSLAETIYDCFTKRISFKDAATANIEWNGEDLWDR